MRLANRALEALVLVLVLAAAASAAEPRSEEYRHFQLREVFDLEWASDPQVCPDGRHVVYVRNSMDVMTDRRRSRLWIVGTDGSGHRPLTSGAGSESSPRFSGDGTRLAYVSRADGSAQLHMRWMDTGVTARLTQLPAAPRGLTFSPDGRSLAFSMLVRERKDEWVKLPKKPPGAEWAKPPIVIDKLIYRSDASGYLEDGYRQIFVVSAEGATPRQVTSGPYHHNGSAVWADGGETLLFSANRHDDRELEPRNSEIYEVRLDDGEIRALTGRKGPDRSPAVSPDGRQVAYLGYDDRYQGYQVTRLYVMSRDGSSPRVLTGELDRGVSSPVWSADGEGLYFGYSDEGNGKVGFVGLDGTLEVLANDLGGSIGRPYSGGSFSVGGDGHVAFTLSRPDRPADVALVLRDTSAAAGLPKGKARLLTDLNADLVGHKDLAEVEEIWWESSYDGRAIQGWIAKPPGFDPVKKHPLILEIHGGPFADYGDRFSAEIQLYAAAGYVVLYANPRGSTSYGEEFGNLIHHAYPSQDYDDLMSGVDAVLGRGYVDEENLFVTGGSGGGVLTAWIVGKTGRFQAAVSAKPVINWYSFVLTSDNYNFYYKYWFPGFPWDHAEHYMAFAALARRQRHHTDDAPDRRGRPPHAHLGVGAALPGLEAAPGRLDASAHSGSVAWHRFASEPADGQGGAHPGLVREVPRRRRAVSRRHLVASAPSPAGC